MAHEISIDSLPVDLTDDDAVEAAYRDDLNLVQEKLTRGISVLIECEKQLTVHLFRALRTRFKALPEGRKLRLITGHAQSGSDDMQVNQTLMQRLLQQLQQAVFSGANHEIIVLPHLDILTTTTRSGLSSETREAAALLYENPSALYLGFKDPSFELPKVIESVFALKIPLIGLARDRLASLICQREARKLGADTFNPFALYKYVSGLNAIRLRQILRHFSTRLDYSPSNPRSREDILHEIRQMTLVADVDLPRVNLNEDIGGYEKVKKQITKEILDLLEAKENIEDPAKIRHLEEIIPKGIIFWGPPGTGKTLFAKAIATALDATVTIVSGPELKSKWVGESEENLRRVFAQARKSAPALIVFDELDSFAAARGTYAGSGVEHSMVNQMLSEMDGFRKEEMVFVIGTTNFVESLDSALLRPGRFELSIHISSPREKDREAILKVYEGKFQITLDDEVRDYAVQKTGGYVDDISRMRYSGDHLYAMMRALKREELRRSEDDFSPTCDDIDEALSRSGDKKKKLQKKEEDTIAVHEAGHAILAYVLPHCPNIEKITIATGEEETLGYVMQAVKKNKYITTEEELRDDICVMLGGREAERQLLGKVSVGAYSDLQRANEVVRMMVEELGMSSSLGALTFNEPAQGGASTIGAKRRSVSEETAREIDVEIQKILDFEWIRAKELLDRHRDELNALRNQLLEEKTLGLKDIKEIFDGKEFKVE
ncbi:MAG: AAA family ATPase [Verrucomicrobiales bacterium]|nr:AAA family ATPase [Verrucomicrobiales bacterium]